MYKIGIDLEYKLNRRNRSLFNSIINHSQFPDLLLIFFFFYLTVYRVWKCETIQSSVWQDNYTYIFRYIVIRKWNKQILSSHSYFQAELYTLYIIYTKIIIVYANIQNFSITTSLLFLVHIEQLPPFSTFFLLLFRQKIHYTSVLYLFPSTSSFLFQFMKFYFVHCIKFIVHKRIYKFLMFPSGIHDEYICIYNIIDLLMLLFIVILHFFHNVNWMIIIYKRRKKILFCHVWNTYLCF